MKLNDQQVVRAMTILGVRPQDFRDIEQAPSFEEGQKRLVAFKARVKASFRRAAMELHPDKTNNDPVKTEDFKLISAAAEEVEGLNFRPRPPPPPPMQVVINFGGVFRGVRFTSTSTSTTTTASVNYWGGFGF